MTVDTLTFLRDLLRRMTLPVKDPDFRMLANQVAQALDELDAALEQENR